MPVYKDENNKTKDKRKWYFMVSYKDIFGNKKRYRSKKYERKEEAEDEEAKFKTLLIEGDHQKNIPFKKLSEEYLIHYKKNVKQSSYYTNSKKIKDHIIPYFEDKKIKDITVHTIEKWKNEIDNKEHNIKIDGKIVSVRYSTQFKQSLFVCLSAILNYGRTYYGLKENVARIVGNFKAPDELPEEMAFWEHTEFEQFISCIEDLTDKTIFSFLYYTGVRKGELLALNWDDIDFQKGTVRINKTVNFKIEGEGYIITTPKTKNSFRSILMPKKLLSLMIEYKTYNKQYKNFNKKWFVFGQYSPYPTTTLWRKLNYYANKSDVKLIRIHDFRHSHASLLINQGANPSIVAERLGHTIQTCLKTYSHMWESKQKEVVNLIDNL